MRVTRLKADKVHGYLAIDVEFLPDLTFLIGLNGCGKTTALRLLMGLLTPSIDELARIDFASARVELETPEGLATIHASREAGGLEVTVTGVSAPLQLDASMLELLSEPRRREEVHATPVIRQLLESQAFQKIRSISTPMFLGLERRLYQQDRFGDFSENMRRRDIAMRRVHVEDESAGGGVVGVGLTEVALLVRDTMSEIRARQEKLDRDLRETLLLNAVRFKPAEAIFEPPSMKAIERYQSKQAELERAANLLRLPLDEVQSSLAQYFDQMSHLSSDLSTKEDPSRKKGYKKGRRGDPPYSSEASVNALMSWLVNKNQVERILENLSKFEEYAANRDALHKPIDRLLELLNKFLVQSNKEVILSGPDRLSVRLPDDSVRPLGALSSGERQLCVMLGQLALNEQLSGSGVFIVDEPELSLHLSWQEMFVSSVRAANADVQLIFATHSPAIILDREENCRFLVKFP